VHTVRPVKGVMLQAMLLAGLVAAPLGSLALFVPIRRHARRAGTWSAIRRLVLAVLGTVVLAAAVVVALRLLSASRHNLIAGVAAVVFASLVWMPVTRRWSARNHPPQPRATRPHRPLPSELLRNPVCPWLRSYVACAPRAPYPRPPSSRAPP